MAYERVMGLRVIDHERYSQYRQLIAPLMFRYGGRFLFDFDVSRDLISPDRQINRVFAARFPDPDTKDRFFNDPEYRAIREQYYNPSVAETHLLSEHLDVA
jgi:uncharacterized protein (DUF1330 family)